MEKSVYIVLSQTGTRFAKALRKVGKLEYNHAAICLDENCDKLYAFARPQHNAVLLGGLVEESLVRYTLRKDISVPVAVYKIAVSEEDYSQIEKNIHDLLGNPDYMYNLFSVLSYPITKGFPVERAFTCIEFIVLMLQNSGYLREVKGYRYKPDDFANDFKQNMIYKGDIRDWLDNSGCSDDYFAPFSMTLFCKSVVAFCKLFKRTCFNRHS